MARQGRAIWSWSSALLGPQWGSGWWLWGWCGVLGLDRLWSPRGQQGKSTSEVWESQYRKYFAPCVQTRIICLVPLQEYLMLKLFRKFRQYLFFLGFFTSSECKCFTKIVQLLWNPIGNLPPDMLWNFFGVLPTHLYGFSIKHLLGTTTMKSGSSRSHRTDRQVDIPHAKTPFCLSGNVNIPGFWSKSLWEQFSKHQNKPQIGRMYVFFPFNFTPMYSTN